MNIWSGAGGLGSALTNPTELAVQKGKLDRHYPVTFRDFTYPDAEAAYHACKSGHVDEDDLMMARVIAAKLEQHLELFEELKQRGGEDFIRTCSHFTYARSDQGKSWEGQGIESRFIRNLLVGYCVAEQAIASRGLRF